MRFLIMRDTGVNGDITSEIICTVKVNTDSAIIIL